MQRMAGRSTGPKFSSDLNQRNIRSRERIHFDMPFIEGEVDWYGRGAAGVLGIGATHRGFVQPVTQHTGSYVPPMSARGVSRKCFLAIMVALVLVLSIPLGSSIVRMSDAAKAVDRLNASINETEALNGDLEAQLAEKNSKYDVRYLAAQMDMHAATSRDIVYLTLPGGN